MVIQEITLINIISLFSKLLEINTMSLVHDLG